MLGIRQCAGCGTAWCVQNSLCCVCWDGLSQNVQTRPVRRFRQFFNSSVYDWNAKTDRLMRQLAISIKGGGNRKLIEFLSEQLAVRVNAGNSILLVVPPSKNYSSNHATLLARGVARIVGARVLELQFLHTPSSKQALLGRKARMNLELLGSGEGVAKGTDVIFLDDVLTTGATSQAAWRALGKPLRFSALTVWDRGISC